MGTYVPAYALNNTFTQIPLIGPILGGGPHEEGLFAVSFQVTGPFETLKTTVNPLSALTPGLLKKFYALSSLYLVFSLHKLTFGECA